jgi:tetratricopeptide (TPR) repeat protein
MAERIAGQPAEQTPDAVARARQSLQAGRLSEALALAQAELREHPADTEMRYIEAVALRYLRRPQQALESLGKLTAHQPAYARAYQEEGHNLKQLGELARAAQAYQRAVDLNPALIASWRELAALHKLENNQREFVIAQAEYKRLSELPRELVSVTSLIHEGRLYRAEKLCRAFLQEHPHQIEAMRLLALLGVKLFVYDDAEFLLESCVELAPDYWLARYDYVSVLHKRQKFEKALQQAKILIDAYPDNHAFQLAYANENVAIGNFDTALQLYDRVIEENPRFAQPFLSRGHALKTIGRLDEAIQSYRSAYEVKPDFGDAFWSLANLKTYRFTDDEVGRMRDQVEDAGISNVDRFHLCFALGAAYESREDYARSFAFYERGNDLKKADTRYDSEAVDAAIQRQIDCCNDELFELKSGMGGSYNDPIFIVGLPRAGSALLEQVLSSH